MAGRTPTFSQAVVIDEDESEETAETAVSLHLSTVRWARKKQSKTNSCEPYGRIPQGIGGRFSYFLRARGASSVALAI